MEGISIRRLLRKQRPGSVSSNSGNSAPRNRRGGLAAYHLRQEKLCNQLLKLAKEDNGQKVRELLENGVELEEVDYGVPALVCASGLGFVETVAVLLRYGAHVNSCDNSGDAPLHAASRKGFVGTMALLLSRGASIDMLSKSDKRSALHLATLNGHDDAVKLLIDNHANIHLPDIYGSTPIHMAARMGRKSTVQLLLAYKADINHYDNDGWTSLHLAAETGNLTVLTCLVENHAHIDCRNKYGRTPLHWAAKKGNSHIVLELLKNNADPNIKDFHSKKPIDYATSPQIINALKPVTHSDHDATDNDKSLPSIGIFIHIDPRHVGVKRTNGTSSTPSQSPSLTDNTSVTSVLDAASDSAFSSKIEDSDTESAPLRQSALPQNITIRRDSSCSDDPTDFRNNNAIITPSGVDSEAAIKKHKAIAARTSHSVVDALVVVQNELSSFAREIKHTSESSASEEAVSIAFSNSHKRLLKLETTVSNLCSEFQADMKSLGQSADNAFNHFKSRLATRTRLPPCYYQAMDHALAVYICKRDNGWQKVIKELDISDKDGVIQDILTKEANDFCRSHCALLRAESIVEKQPETWLRDTMNFIEGCDLGEWDPEAIVADCMQLVNVSFKGGELPQGNDLLTKLAEELHDDGKELGQRLGISLIDLAKIESKLKVSSQDLCFGILSHYRDSQAKNKLFLLASKLVEIGREDCLNVFS